MNMFHSSYGHLNSRPSQTRANNLGIGLSAPRISVTDEKWLSFVAATRAVASRTTNMTKAGLDRVCRREREKVSC